MMSDLAKTITLGLMCLAVYKLYVLHALGAANIDDVVILVWYSTLTVYALFR